MAVVAIFLFSLRHESEDIDHCSLFGRSVSLFYELSTCDYYFIQKVKNSYITPDKWLTLSFGIQIEWL